MGVGTALMIQKVTQIQLKKAKTLSDLRLYYQAIVKKKKKTVRYWNKNRHQDQQKSLESSEINPYTYVPLIHNKASENKQQRKDNAFNNQAEKTGRLHIKE